MLLSIATDELIPKERVKDHGVQIFTSRWQQSTENRRECVVILSTSPSHAAFLLEGSLCQLYMDARFDNKIGESETM